MLLHLGAFAFFVSLAVSGFMRAVKLMDIPGARSSHTVVTPTSGGLGVLMGCASAMLALKLFYPQIELDGFLAGLSGLGLLIAALGLLDDIFNLNARLKFSLLILLCALAPLVTGVPQALPFGASEIGFPPFIAFGGAVLWIFTVTNIVNFMDGANGLMGSVMMIASAGLAAVGLMTGITDAALIGALLTFAIAGFLAYNFRSPAQIFCGDVGSLFIGFVFACGVLRLTAHPHGHGLLYVGPLLILPLLTDGLLTLLRRARLSENLLLAHRSHLYQRLIISGKSHLSVSVRYAIAALVCAALVIAGGQTGAIGYASYFLAILGIAIFIWIKASRRAG